MCLKNDVTVTFEPLPDGKFDAVCRVPFAKETCTWRVTIGPQSYRLFSDAIANHLRTICSQSVARVRYYALLGVSEEYSN